MTDTATDSGWTEPSIDDVQKMSAGQAAVAKAQGLAQQKFSSRYLSGEATSRRLVDALTERSQTETAESLIDAARDPNTPQPFAGGVLRNGVSKADEIAGARDMLATGASIEELAEFEVGEAMVSPEDFRAIERTVRSRCIDNPEFMKRYLSGDPEARAIMDRWHRISVTSRPLPPTPTTGIAR